MQKSKDIKPLDNDGQRHGYWERYWSDGTLMCKGTYHHGKPHGYWEQYFDNGTLWFKGTYHHDEHIGYWVWDNNTEYYARM